ncbi:glycosyltransferase [Pedobacter sp. MW01-1-1]|uniref:glycosyltransferase n=1 Tax=Pedobacter sp. MW01-1-1 TaxID=3383027 RepID=UPI003FED999A
MIKVLMIARATLYSSPGGDTVQILKTASFLVQLGVEVDVKLTTDVLDYAQYDLAHFFNIIRPDDIIPHIKKLTIPYVVSTIYVDYSEYEQNNRSGIIGLISRILNSDQLEYVKVLARFVKNGDKINSVDYLLKGHRKSVQYVAEKSALLLPNSHSEYNRLAKDYQLKHPYEKVVNAIDPSVFKEDAEVNEQYQDYVLSVGRIEGRKNQLNLIKALAGTGLKLALIGKPSPNHLAYYEQCKALATETGNVTFIEHIEHTELVKIYKAAKVHVLPSWFETTGLSSLEAAVMDCSIVVSAKGDTEEYFQDMAYYCDPDKVETIREAVLKAHQAPVNGKLKAYVLEHYTWLKTAEQTLAAYNSVLNRKTA